MPTDPALPPRARLRVGVRAGAPYAAASFVLAVSFGVVATGQGLSGRAAVVMSAVVFAGSAQFASVGIASAGGSLFAAVSAAALVNSRFLPMGLALGPSLIGSRLRRAVQGQAVVDSAWAMAARGDGSFDRPYLFGHTGVQYVGWLTGTVVGVLLAVFGGGLDAQALGLDAVFPAFFAALLVSEVRAGRARGLPSLPVGALGAGLALLLVPFAPIGVPVLVASSAALLGLRRPGETSGPATPPGPAGPGGQPGPPGPDPFQGDAP